MNVLAEFDGKEMDGLEFCFRVYRLYESIRGADDGASRMRLRRGPVKKLLEELLPIAKYVQARYRPGRYISVRWVLGKGHNAELSQRGAYVSENYYPVSSHLEVTCAMHPNEYLVREQLDRKGIAFGVDGIRRIKKTGEIESEPVGYRKPEFIEAYSKLVLKEIAKKVRKKYPRNTTLIVQCTLNLPYRSDEWDTLIAYLKPIIPKNSFDEIYLYDPLGQYSHSF
jgi:hypothetical protein